MATKADFTAEEWLQISTAPQMAALYVTFSSPSGLVGAVKEMMVYPKLIVEAMKAASGNALIDAVAADFKAKLETKQKPELPQMSRNPEEIKAQCLQACRGLAWLLSQKAPAEAEGYKQWVYKAAQYSAEAAKEGGFLGFGGIKVNEAETAALKEIASALGIPT